MLMLRIRKAILSLVEHLTAWDPHLLMRRRQCSRVNAVLLKGNGKCVGSEPSRSFECFASLCPFSIPPPPSGGVCLAVFLAPIWIARTAQYTNSYNETDLQITWWIVCALVWCTRSWCFVGTQMGLNTGRLCFAYLRWERWFSNQIWCAPKKSLRSVSVAWWWSRSWCHMILECPNRTRLHFTVHGL